VGGGRDAARIDLLHLLGVRQDVGKLSGQQLLFFVAELEMRQRGDAFDVTDGEMRGHDAMLSREARGASRSADLGRAPVDSQRPT
jgi:hypothetical protein